MTKELVSVVVATYNEEKNINFLLRSCKEQSYSPVEIIVVDSSNSTDKTLSIAKKYTPKAYRYGTERSMQRNYGVSKARGKYVLVLDADMILNSDVILAAMTVFKNPKIGGVIIPEKSFGESYWAKCKALERNCYIGDESIEASRMFQKSLFVKVGGYNVKMISGEDWDLHNKIKKISKIGRVNKFIAHNEGKLSLMKDLKKKMYYSRQADEYLSTNISSSRQVLKFIFRPAYLRNWRLLVSDPLHLPGLIIMKFLELFLGGIIIFSKPSFWSSVKK